jgi:hypothetical protein
MPKVKDMYVCKVKAGMGGFAKNKGSVAMRFKVNDSTLAFLSCHLASGEGQVEKRNDMLKTILDSCFQKHKGFPKAVDHNFLFVFGDLNFRVTKDNKSVRVAIKDKNLEYLRKNDELLKLLHDAKNE